MKVPGVQGNTQVGNGDGGPAGTEICVSLCMFAADQFNILNVQDLPAQ